MTGGTNTCSHVDVHCYVSSGVNMSRVIVFICREQLHGNSNVVLARSARAQKHHATSRRLLSPHADRVAHACFRDAESDTSKLPLSIHSDSESIAVLWLVT